jgi:hypothetical protein
VRRLRALLVRLAATILWRTEGFDAELEAHLGHAIDENIRAGMTPGDARREAIIALGGLAQTRESHREQRHLPLLEKTRVFDAS